MTPASAFRAWAAVSAGALVYLAWIVGGLLSLFGAMTYAELATMMPYAGGEYLYLRGAYGDTAGFLYMWTWFTVANPGSIATVTLGLARTLEFFPVFSHLSDPIPGMPFTLYWSQPFAIAVTWLITGLNYLGIKKAGDFQLVFTVLKAVLIVIVVALCFHSASGSWSHFLTRLPQATGGWNGFMLALIATLWAYDGWSDLSMVAGEVRRPGRNLPLALIGGLVAVAALYMATNAAIQYVLPAQAIAGSEWPAVAALRAYLEGQRPELVQANREATWVFVSRGGKGLTRVASVRGRTAPSSRCGASPAKGEYP